MMEKQKRNKKALTVGKDRAKICKTCTIYAHLKALLIWRKVDPGKRVTLPAESTLTSGSYEKRVVPFARAKRVRVCSDCLKTAHTHTLLQVILL